MILFFMVMTGTRESYKEEVVRFLQSLQATAAILADRTYEIYSIKMSDIEAVVYQHKPDVVNQLRKLRRQGQYVPPDNLSIDNDESLA